MTSVNVKCLLNIELSIDKIIFLFSKFGFVKYPSKLIKLSTFGKLNPDNIGIYELKAHKYNNSSKLS